MLGNIDIYEPDDILLDIDSTEEFWQDEELKELSFENESETVQGLVSFKTEFDSPEEIFAQI